MIESSDISGATNKGAESLGARDMRAPGLSDSSASQAGAYRQREVAATPIGPDAVGNTAIHVVIKNGFVAIIAMSPLAIQGVA